MSVHLSNFYDAAQYRQIIKSQPKEPPADSQPQKPLLTRANNSPAKSLVSTLDVVPLESDQPLPVLQRQSQITTPAAAQVQQTRRASLPPSFTQTSTTTPATPPSFVAAPSPSSSPVIRSSTKQPIHPTQPIINNNQHALVTHHSTASSSASESPPPPRRAVKQSPSFQTDINDMKLFLGTELTSRGLAKTLVTSGVTVEVLLSKWEKNRQDYSWLADEGVLNSQDRMEIYEKIGERLADDTTPCGKCGISIGSTSPIRKIDTSIVHEKCSNCEVCGLPVRAGILENRKIFHPQCRELQSNAEPPALICATCREPIVSHYVLINGNSYHDACFLCCGCQASLLEGYAMIDGNPLCGKCAKKSRKGKKTGKESM
eukprot:c3033_g1_i1.p1 GENE.c3033_g1_i1~~c3033_g1_i1.p1  ORF type:complete len:420 (+),score=87.19 c3033_g1_i1:143-1261(+)